MKSYEAEKIGRYLTTIVGFNCRITKDSIFDDYKLTIGIDSRNVEDFTELISKLSEQPTVEQRIDAIREELEQTINDIIKGKE